MWIMISDCFLSIVSKDCKPSELLVRARRQGDIEKLFPTAKVVKVDHADYLFRAVVDRTEIVAAMSGEVGRIDYPNFKDSVTDDALHNAYSQVWLAMMAVQTKPPAPYGGWLGDLLSRAEPEAKKKRKRKARRRHPQTTFMDLG